MKLDFSCDLNSCFSIKIRSLNGWFESCVDHGFHTKSCSDTLLASVNLCNGTDSMMWKGSDCLLSSGLETMVVSGKVFHMYKWDEAVFWPVRISNLSLDSVVHAQFWMWDSLVTASTSPSSSITFPGSKLVGECRVPVFNVENGMLNQGRVHVPLCSNTMTADDQTMIVIEFPKHSSPIHHRRNWPKCPQLRPGIVHMEEVDQLLTRARDLDRNCRDKEILWIWRKYVVIKRKQFSLMISLFRDDSPRLDELSLLMGQVSKKLAVPDLIDLIVVSQSVDHPQVNQVVTSQLEMLTNDELEIYLFVFVTLALNKETCSNYIMDYFFRRCNSQVMAPVLYWILHIKSLDDTRSSSQVFRSSVGEQAIGSLIDSQVEFVKALCAISDHVNMRSDRRKKIDVLKTLLNTQNNLAHLNLSLPYSSVSLSSLLPDLSECFKSSLEPIKLTFLEFDHKHHSLIFKNGQDLRQDHMISQIIQIINHVWKSSMLDLSLIYYQVVPFTPTKGIIEHIDGTTLSQILSQYSNISAFLQQLGPDPDSNTINPQILDNYVRSCAGYCIITFVLGIGDRHLDNLLVSPKGQLFHVDFEHAFGSDPKPFPPPMKLTKEMIQVFMDYESSFSSMDLFVNHCVVSYVLLRRNYHLLAKVLSIISGQDALLFVRIRLKLDLDEDMAIKELKNLLDESINAFLPQILETIHRWAQYWRV